MTVNLKKPNQTFNNDRIDSVVGLIQAETSFEKYFLFIKRSKNINSHPDQVALIGGKVDKIDKNPLETFLREFHEETQVAPRCLQLIEALPNLQTRQMQSVLPLFFQLKEKFENENDLSIWATQLISNGEWDQAFWVPLSWLKNQNHWVRGEYYLSNNTFNTLAQEILFCSLSQIPNSPCLWGTTARIIWNYLFQTKD